MNDKKIVDGDVLAIASEVQNFQNLIAFKCTKANIKRIVKAMIENEDYDFLYIVCKNFKAPTDDPMDGWKTVDRYVLMFPNYQNIALYYDVEVKGSKKDEQP